MGKEKRKILEMLAKGKINVDDAEKLLSAISTGETGHEERRTESSLDEKSRLKYLRVVVEPGEKSKKKEKVNIRVPLKLIRSGLKWASFIPKGAKAKMNEKLKEKGIEMDFTKMTKDDLEVLIENLNDLTIDVEGEEKVRIFCE